MTAPDGPSTTSYLSIDHIIPLQVHTGTLADGTAVVVKVLYPEIRKNMQADLATMQVCCSLRSRYNLHERLLNCAHGSAQ